MATAEHAVSQNGVGGCKKAEGGLEIPTLHANNLNETTW